MTALLCLLICLGAGLVGGVFFAFSTFVLRALADLPAAQGVAAMQRINIVVLRPGFLGVFVGTVLLAVAAIVAAFWPWQPGRSPWLLAAAVLYAAGGFGVTMVFNVPRNERLARLPADSAEAAAYWPAYVREWQIWNHVRMAACAVSSVCAAVALAR